MIIDSFNRTPADKARAPGSTVVGAFALENPMLLRVDLKDEVYMRTGTMIAYCGGIRFNRIGPFSNGMGKGLRKMMAGESGKVTIASGNGKLWLAHRAKIIHLIRMRDEPVCINGTGLLAFEPTVAWDAQFIRKSMSFFTSRLCNIRLEGTGAVAITTHGQPMIMRVTPDDPLITDPHATVAWSGSLETELKVDFSLKSLIGRGSGEFSQMIFRGNGFVILQPYEEKPYYRSDASGDSGDSG